MFFPNTGSFGTDPGGVRKRENPHEIREKGILEWLMRNPEAAKRRVKQGGVRKRLEKFKYDKGYSGRRHNKITSIKRIETDA